MTLCSRGGLETTLSPSRDVTPVVPKTAVYTLRLHQIPLCWLHTPLRLCLWRYVSKEEGQSGTMRLAEDHDWKVGPQVDVCADYNSDSCTLMYKRVEFGTSSFARNSSFQFSFAISLVAEDNTILARSSLFNVVSRRPSRASSLAPLHLSVYNTECENKIRYQSPAAVHSPNSFSSESCESSDAEDSHGWPSWPQKTFDTAAEYSFPLEDFNDVQDLDWLMESLQDQDYEPLLPSVDAPMNLFPSE